jgi:seryl-tRNA synthetase
MKNLEDKKSDMKDWYEALLEFKKWQEKRTRDIEELNDVRTRIDAIIEIIRRNGLLDAETKKDLIEKLKDIKDTVSIPMRGLKYLEKVLGYE